MNTHTVAFMVEDMRIKVESPGLYVRLTFERDGNQLSICTRDKHEKEDLRRIINACRRGIAELERPGVE